MIRRAASLVVKQPWVRRAAVTLPFVRDLAWRFVAGEDLDAGVAAVRALNARGIKGTLNHVGTHVRTEAGAIAAADVAIASLHRIRRETLDANLSLKLTEIGLDVGEGLCRAQLRRIVDCAGELGCFVRIDMEESPYVARTLALFDEVRVTHGPDTVGIVVQSYVRHRDGDLDRLLDAGARVRIVKGGYWESPSVVHRRREDVSAAFLRDVRRVIARGRQPAIATHDPGAIAEACRAAAEAGVGRGSFELQMLLGVARPLQDRLVREGHAVRCYVPWGKGWYEYFLGCARRLPGGALRRMGERLRVRA